MENASKALIIAGAILISILLISVGIMIFNSSSGLFDSAKSSMSEQEISMFNQKFTIYEGESVSGTQVKELFRVVKTNNSGTDTQKVKINSTEITSTTTLSVTSTGRYKVECVTNAQGVVDNINVTKLNNATTLTISNGGAS